MRTKKIARPPSSRRRLNLPSLSDTDDEIISSGSDASKGNKATVSQTRQAVPARPRQFLRDDSSEVSSSARKDSSNSVTSSDDSWSPTSSDEKRGKQVFQPYSVAKKNEGQAVKLEGRSVSVKRDSGDENDSSGYIMGNFRRCGRARKKTDRYGSRHEQNDRTAKKEERGGKPAGSVEVTVAPKPRKTKRNPRHKKFKMEQKSPSVSTRKGERTQKEGEASTAVKRQNSSCGASMERGQMRSKSNVANPLVPSCSASLPPCPFEVGTVVWVTDGRENFPYPATVVSQTVHPPSLQENYHKSLRQWARIEIKWDMGRSELVELSRVSAMFSARQTKTEVLLGAEGGATDGDDASFDGLTQLRRSRRAKTKTDRYGSNAINDGAVKEEGEEAKFPGCTETKAKRKSRKRKGSRKLKIEKSGFLDSEARPTAENQADSDCTIEHVPCRPHAVWLKRNRDACFCEKEAWKGLNVERDVSTEESDDDGFHEENCSASSECQESAVALSAHNGKLDSSHFLAKADGEIPLGGRSDPDAVFRRLGEVETVEPPPCETSSNGGKVSTPLDTFSSVGKDVIREHAGVQQERTKIWIDSEVSSTSEDEKQRSARRRETADTTDMSELLDGLDVPVTMRSSSCTAGPADLASLLADIGGKSNCGDGGNDGDVETLSATEEETSVIVLLDDEEEEQAEETSSDYRSDGGDFGQKDRPICIDLDSE